MIRDSRWDVAVVVPTYNRAHLIGDTLDSVLAQTHAPAEIIVVDDGSVDETQAIVRTYGSKVRYQRIDNSGVCCARNVGVRLTSSSWVALCDSDDLWRPDKLARQVALLGRVRDLEYVFSDFVIVTDRGREDTTKFGRAPSGYWDGRRELDRESWVFDEPLYDRLLRYHPIFPSTLMMSRAFFERVGGFDEQWGRTVGEDVEFTLRCMQHAPVAAVARPLVGIRKHASNFSRDDLGSALGLMSIYRHALRHHRPMGVRYAALLEQQIAMETQSAIEFAFAAGRLDIVRDLRRSAPVRPSRKLHLKLAVSRLPWLIGRPLCRALVFGREALAR